MQTPSRNGFQSSSNEPALVDQMATLTVQTYGTISTPIQTPATVIPSYDVVIIEEDLNAIVLRAAQETAIAHYDTSDEFELRRVVFKHCQKISNIEAFRTLLSYDDRLPQCRSTNLDHLAPDGQTPLHACASHNNIQGFHVLVNEFKVDTWERDLRGRTPLHIAAENGHQDMCRLLRDAMHRQRNIDPIGPGAPLDLAGTTPLGGACYRKRGIMPEIASALFRPGDRTILPHTPISTRIGKSPWKAPLSPTDDLVYAFSEAQGWSRRMEDRMVALSPVPGFKTWSLFAVFDGHGGSFCSQYLSEHFPSIIASAANDIIASSSEHSIPDMDSPEMLHRTMVAACIRAEDDLRRHPRLRVRKVGTKYRCHDNSGSTGVIALVTPHHILVGNVGDSRAVLCRLPESNSNYSHHNSQKSTSNTTVEAKAMSYDHKFNIKSEARRAISAGAKVQRVRYRLPGTNEDVEQVEVKLDDEEMTADGDYLTGSHEVITTANDSKLRMSRSFGDFTFKLNDSRSHSEQAVIAVPEVIVHERDHRDLCLVLACDGVWDVMSNDDVCNFMHAQFYDKPSSNLLINTSAAAIACDNLLEETIRRGSQDNLTVVVAAFPAAAFTHHHHEASVDAIDLVIADVTNTSPLVSSPPMIADEPTSADEASPVSTTSDSHVRHLEFPSS